MSRGTQVRIPTDVLVMIKDQARPGESLGQTMRRLLTGKARLTDEEYAKMGKAPPDVMLGPSWRRD